MANNIKGITIDIGGNTAPLQNSLKDVNKTSRDLQSELRQVNSQLKFDPSNTTLLAQKQALLAESITNTKGKLETLKDAEKQVEQQFSNGKIGEEQYRSLQREVIKTEEELKRLEKQASTCNTTLGKISETSRKIGDTAGNVAGKMTPATIAIGALGTAAFNLGSDFIESTNKVEVAFKDNAKGVEDWSKTTLDKFGIASGSALDMASLFGDMGTAMGQSTDEAANMSTSLVGLAGDLSSFKNIGLDQAQDALKGIYTGEGESLKSLGVIMQDSTLKEYALSQGITKKYENMTQGEKVQLRYNYVMAMTKNAQGDFANTSDGAANSMRVASESAKEAASSIGVMLAPTIAKAAQYVASLLKGFTGLDEGTKTVILVVLGLIAAIAPVAKLIQGITIIVGAASTAMATISGAIALYTGTATTASAASTALAGAITFITGPVGITIAIITALVAAFIYFWNTSDSFRSFWIELWENIKIIASNVLNALITFFTVTIPAAWDSLVAFFNGIPAWFSNLWTSIKTITESIWNGIKTFFASIWNSIVTTATTVFDGLGIFFINLWTGVKSLFTTVWNAIVTGVIAILQPFVIGITNIFNSIKPGLTTVFNGIKLFFIGVWNAIKLIFLAPILLICDLVTGNFGRLKEDAVKIFTSLQNAFTQIWDGIKLIFTGEVTAIASFLKLAWDSIVIGATTIWNELSTFFVGLWIGIKTVAQEAWEGLKTIVVSVCEGISTGVINIWNGVTTFFVGLWTGIKTVAQEAWEGLKSIVVSICEGISTGVTTIWNGIVNFFQNLPTTLYNLGVNIFTNLKNGIGSILDTLGSYITEGFNSAIKFITELPGEAVTWGKDFVQGLVDGIESAASAVGDAVKGIAQDIRSFLHFSVPDQGPLIDYETWMPDFMEGLSKGIENSKRKVIDSIKGLSTDISIGMNPQAYTQLSTDGSSVAPSINNNGITLNIENFNNNSNQDINQLSQELAFITKRNPIK